MWMSLRSSNHNVAVPAFDFFDFDWGNQWMFSRITESFAAHLNQHALANPVACLGVSERN